MLHYILYTYITCKKLHLFPSLSTSTSTSTRLHLVSPYLTLPFRFDLICYHEIRVKEFDISMSKLVDYQLIGRLFTECREGEGILCGMRWDG